jgi:single-strand DNA-binding protein
VWQKDDVVEVEGALQRRFWRTPNGTASVCEVNCRKGRKVPRSSVPLVDRSA